jgi:hypothetical protein
MVTVRRINVDPFEPQAKDMITKVKDVIKGVAMLPDDCLVWYCQRM